MPPVSGGKGGIDGQKRRRLPPPASVIAADVAGDGPPPSQAYLRLCSVTVHRTNGVLWVGEPGLWLPLTFPTPAPHERFIVIQR